MGISPIDFARSAYSVSQVSQVNLPDGSFRFCPDQTMINEVGHNMGNRHNLGDVGIFKYSYGWIISSGMWRTIMSYQKNNETRVSYWSNPRVNFIADEVTIYKTATYKTSSSKANCVKSMKKTGKKAKNWRK